MKTTNYTSYNSKLGCQTSSTSPKKHSLWHETKINEKKWEIRIIQPIQELTDWVNSLVIVEKQNGRLRLCLDPRDLNKAIKREHFKLPTAEEIFAEMINLKYFTKLDESNRYWHIPVDEYSSKLLTFNSPFGHFSFTRQPYGIQSTSEVFQVQVA